MLAARRRPVVTVYVRHSEGCRDRRKGEFYRGCHCAKWLRWSLAGKQPRCTASTRTWGLAEEKAQEQQRRLDAGDSTPAAVSAPTANPTIEQAIETFILGKEGEGVGQATVRKLRHQLGTFEAFMSARSKFYPSEITAQDVIEFRATWASWKSGVTRQKAQQNLRGFLRFCCRADAAAELLKTLKTIRLSKADTERLKPQPFSEDELKTLLDQVPKTFPDPKKVARVMALIHCMVSTGLAIRDTIQLEKHHIKGGWLRLNRQKTGREVKQKLDAALHKELIGVLNGNPKYVFWSGSNLPTSEVGLWQANLRTLMEAAGCWIKGNLSHRFRDTAVDFWLGAGCSMTEIAAMLGDTVAIVEKHYADLASKRMEERLSKIPVRSWKPEEKIQ